jgi:predicted oxidoreductase (fatty acid repression mutant protein)
VYGSLSSRIQSYNKFCLKNLDNVVGLSVGKGMTPSWFCSQSKFSRFVVIIGALHQNPWHETHSAFICMYSSLR